MNKLLLEPTVTLDPPAPPDISHLITEDDTPVDNLFSEKQQRLLTRALYSSWSGPGEGQPFLVAANVGVYYSTRYPPIVPDVFLSLDVEMPEEWWETAGRSYLVWEMGKPPDVGIEIVSNAKGGETSRKLQDYARARIGYYVIFDPDRRIQEQMLVIYQLRGNVYVETDELGAAQFQLRLTLWEGEFEGRRAVWLRWCDQAGHLILTGQERAERLTAQLRAAGIEPEV